MNIASLIVVFFINWLILFFIFLPIGLKIPEEQKLGNANSAPHKPHLFLKTISSFLLSFLTTSGIVFILKSYIV